MKIRLPDESSICRLIQNGPARRIVTRPASSSGTDTGNAAPAPSPVTVAPSKGTIHSTPGQITIRLVPLAFFRVIRHVSTPNAMNTKTIAIPVYHPATNAMRKAA